MNIKIICVGKLKEKYWKEAVAEYSKRLKGYINLEIIEIKESRLPSNPGVSEENMVKFSEGQDILSKISKSTEVITLEIKGEKLDSLELASKIGEMADTGKNDIAFIIGGSLGLSEEVSSRADYKLSFSDMTFPHQMMRVILLEQIYRSIKILKNEPYHK